MEAAGLRVRDVFYNQIGSFLRTPLSARRAGERAELGFFYRRGQREPRRVFLREAQHDAYGCGRGGCEPREVRARRSARVAEPYD